MGVLEAGPVETANRREDDVIEIALAAAVALHRVEPQLERRDPLRAVRASDGTVDEALDGERRGLDQLRPVIDRVERIEVLDAARIRDRDEPVELPEVLDGQRDALLVGKTPENVRRDGAAEVGMEAARPSAAMRRAYRHAAGRPAASSARCTKARRSGRNAGSIVCGSGYSPVPGLQWGQGAVGNAEWSGVSLSAILEKAGVKKSAVEVVLEGADKGQVNLDPKSPGPIHFARSVPIEKAKSESVLLAYKMNGETLPASHGYPLRAVVGGWYGMASTKWLTRINVSDKPFQCFWQSLDYSYFERRDGLPTLIPVTAMLPKAILARPGLHEVIPAGKSFRLFGAAWAGERPVGKVDVSLDGGKTWVRAKLLAESKALQWVFWEYVWENPAKGAASIVARSTDDRGQTQPATRDPDRRTYMINHLVPTSVTVR